MRTKAKKRRMRNEDHSSPARRNRLAWGNSAVMRAVPALLLWLLTACPGKCPEPQYEGKATDEAYLSMVDAESRATADAMKAPQLQVTEGMQFPSSPVPTFRWTSTLTASATPPPRAAPSSPWYRELLYGSAWAHLPPVTGSVFWFKIAVPGELCPVELLSTRTEWTPTAEIWTKLGKGSGPRTVTAQSAYLTENRITEGPFKMPSAITFSVSP